MVNCRPNKGVHDLAWSSSSLVGSSLVFSSGESTTHLLDPLLTLLAPGLNRKPCEIECHHGRSFVPDRPTLSSFLFCPVQMWSPYTMGLLELSPRLLYSRWWQRALLSPGLEIRHWLPLAGGSPRECLFALSGFVSLLFMFKKCLMKLWHYDS